MNKSGDFAFSRNQWTLHWWSSCKKKEVSPALLVCCQTVGLCVNTAGLVPMDKPLGVVRGIVGDCGTRLERGKNVLGWNYR